MLLLSSRLYRFFIPKNMINIVSIGSYQITCVYFTRFRLIILLEMNIKFA